MWRVSIWLYCIISILHAPFFPCIFLSIVCSTAFTMFTTLFRISVLYLFIFYFSASACANIQSIVSLLCDELNFIQQRRGRKTQIFFKLEEFSPFWPRVLDDKERKYKENTIFFLFLAKLQCLCSLSKSPLIPKARKWSRLTQSLNEEKGASSG